MIEPRRVGAVPNEASAARAIENLEGQPSVTSLSISLAVVRPRQRRSPQCANCPTEMGTGELSLAAKSRCDSFGGRLTQKAGKN